MKSIVLFMTGAVALAVGAAVAAEKEDPVWTMEPRTPWLTPAREVVNLGGPGSDWKATYTRAIQGEFIKMAGSAKVHRWSDEPVDEAKAKWIPVNLPQTKFQATHWKLGVGYYERTVTLTKEQASRNVRISFEQIGVHYRVWVNGQLAVDVPQSSSFLEQHDISAFVKAGENTIRISVGDKMGDDSSWIDWPLNGCKHGIVRPFYLEFRDKIAIEKVAVRTQVMPEKVMTALVSVTNTSAQIAEVFVKAKVEGEGEQRNGKLLCSTSTFDFDSQRVELKPGEGKVVELKKPWPEAKLWSPADPKLYNLGVSLNGAAGVRALPGDAYKVRFGFREVRWVGTDHRALLNGKPFMMLRNTTAPFTCDRDKNREMINRLKSRGIVGYRYFTQNPDLARFCDLCDEEGFLVVTAAASGWGAGFKTEAFWPRWKRMLGKMMDQCMNSPAIICWGISNEFGTVYGGKDNIANAVKQGEVGEWVQERDPTRPWECYGEIELRWHGKEGPMPIRSCHYPVGVAGTVLPQGGRWYADGGRGWQGAFTNDKPVSVSEDLFHGFQDSHATMAKALVGDRIYTLDGYGDACWYTLRNFCEGYLSGGLAAWDPWCFYVECEKNPLFDGPRGTPHTTRLIMLKEHRRNLTAGKATPLTLTVINGGFAAEKGKLARKMTIGGKIVADDETVRMDLGAGEMREMKVDFTMPSVEAITPVKVMYTWTSEGGAKIAETEFDFMAVPAMTLADVEVPGDVAAVVTKTNSVLPQLNFKKGVHGRVADAIKAKPEAIVLNGSLLPQDAQMLDDWVKEGGRVLQLEPELTDWSVATLPSEKTAGWFKYSFSFRRDDNHMKAIPEEAMRLWAPNGYVGAMAFPKPKTDARVLWESVHAGGMKWAEVAWFWRGKGGWLVSCIPATARLGIEPVAPHFLKAVFDELVAKNAVAPTRKTVLVDFGPNPADGTNAVRHVAELLAQQGATFEQVKFGGVLPKIDDSVFVVDAKGTNLTATAKAFVQKIAAKGGRVLVLDMGKDEDSAWLKYLGVSWEKPFEKKMAPLPWGDHAMKEVDQSRRFFTRIGNAGAIAGINNEDLFWWKPDQMWGFWRSRLTGERPPLFLSDKGPHLLGEPVSAYFESTDDQTHVLTRPGAIAMKTVEVGVPEKSGVVVFTTFSLSKKDYGGDHPDKVYRTIKTILNNLGARTSKAAMPSEFEFVDLKPYANVASWRKPGAERLCFVPKKDSGIDYRFFPVNKCGWSITAQNFCPAEEFPSVPLCYDGVYFQFVNSDENGGKDLLFRRRKEDKPVVIKLPKPIKAKKLHFLGFGMWLGGADVWFGDQKDPVKIKGGDHVGNWANNWDGTKRGKKVYSGVWDVPHAERGEKYKPGKAFVYHWFIENPEPEKPIDKLTLGPGLGYFAITIEK